jgi:hypothetical protein
MQENANYTNSLSVDEKIQQVINSPGFKSWFGNSKIRDKSGNPLLVYHGTNHSNIT